MLTAMRNVHLHGFLAEKYGPKFRLAVDDALHAIRLLSANFPSFQADIWSGHFRVVRGDPETGYHLAEHSLHIKLGARDLHIIPVAEGAKDGAGIGKAIIGAVIVVAAVALAPATGGASAAAGGAFGQGAGMAAGAAGLAAPVFGTAITYGNIALFGAALALGGITQLLSPQAGVNSYDDRERPEERPSFFFNGAVNTSEQGGIRQIVYGQMIVGSKAVSAGLAVEQI